MTFLLPILVAVALNFMGSIDLSSLGELHFVQSNFTDVLADTNTGVAAKMAITR